MSNAQNDLENFLSAATLGDKDAAERFLQELLNSKIYVLRRNQSFPIKEIATYPNSILDLLALQGDGKIIVPAFLSVEALKEWSQAEFLTREITGIELFKLVSEDWWIAINPGSEFNKELSPWEIKELRLGKDGIASVLADMDNEIGTELAIEEISQQELSELKTALSAFAKDTPAIKRMALLRSFTETIEGTKQVSLKLGVEVESTDAEAMEAMRQSISALANKCQVGAESVRVICGSDRQAVALSPFINIEPFYDSKPTTGWTSRLAKLLKL